MAHRLEIGAETTGTMIQVSERDYMRNEAERLSAFAQLIRESGISVYEIAKGTRIKYDTLLRALRGKSIRSDLEARVRFYINIKKQSSNEEATN